MSPSEWIFDEDLTLGEDTEASSKSESSSIVSRRSDSSPLTTNSSSFFDASRRTRGNYRMYACVLMSMSGGFMFGVNQATFGNVQSFESFQRDWCDDDFLMGEGSCRGDGAISNGKWQGGFVAWAVAWVVIGLAVGGMGIGPLISNRWGRKMCTALSALLCVAGCATTAFVPVGRIGIFMLGRFVTGVACGANCFVGPLLVSEIVSPHLRQSSPQYFQLSVTIGSAFAVYVTTAVPRDDDDDEYRIGLMLPTIPAGLILLLLCVVPESPLYEIKKTASASKQDAISIILDALSETRVTGQDEEDVAILRDEAAELYRWFRKTQPIERTSWSSLVRKKDLARLTFVAVFMQIGQQLSFINVFMCFGSTVFRALGMSRPFVYNCAIQTVMVLTVAYVIVRTTLHDREFSGRRSRVLARASMMGPALIVVGAASRTDLGVNVAYIMLAFFALCYQCVWGVSFRDDVFGIFSASEREKVTAVALWCQSLTNLVTVVSAPALYSWDIEYAMYVYGGINVITFLTLYYLFRSLSIEGDGTENIFADVNRSAGRRTERRRRRERRHQTRDRPTSALTEAMLKSHDDDADDDAERGHRKQQSSVGWGQYAALTTSGPQFVER